MPNESPRLSILLYGLEPDLVAELQSVLGQHEVFVLTEQETAECAEALRRCAADVVFCASDKQCVESCLVAVAVARPSASVVVATRQPEVCEWLDAMEAGAADYCAAPFEREQVLWILQSSVYRMRAAAA